MPVSFPVSFPTWFYSKCSSSPPLLPNKRSSFLYCRLVEESDFKATKELFGGDKEERSLEGFIPKTEAEYLEYATLVAEKVTPFQVRASATAGVRIRITSKCSFVASHLADRIRSLVALEWGPGCFGVMPH